MSLFLHRAGVLASGAAAWTPADDAGLTKWLAQGDWTVSGGLISQWNDSSGNARHISQGTGSKQPAEAGSGVTLGADFDGVDDILTGTPHMAAAGQQSVFVVASSRAGGADDYYFSESKTATTNSLYLIFGTDGIGNRRIIIRSDTSTGTLQEGVNGAGVETGSPVAILETVDTGTNFTGRMDGVITFPSTAYTRGTLTPNTLNVGAVTRVTEQLHTSIVIHEIVCTSSVDAPTVTLHREYLAAKFGVTL